MNNRAAISSHMFIYFNISIFLHIYKCPFFRTFIEHVSETYKLFRRNGDVFAVLNIYGVTGGLYRKLEEFHRQKMQTLVRGLLSE